MEYFDFAVSYIWEYDVEFVKILEDTFLENELSFYVIWDENATYVADALKNRKLDFGAYLDRASDVDERFDPIGKILTRRKKLIINPYDKIEFASDKATMHLEFIANGIYTPYTIIIPPYKKNKFIYISIADLAKLGRPFIIKPANTTGGGIGVVTGAETLEDALKERKQFDADKYLLQEKIEPTILDGRRAWFRCFWSCGKVIPTWWDDLTHVYKIVYPEEIEKYKLYELYKITRKIHKITGMNFFSTEIAITKDNKFVSIDYVNDQCDMRPKSNHYDGVPDEVIYDIAYYMMNFVYKNLYQK